jgi:hypothetical protein
MKRVFAFHASDHPNFRITLQQHEYEYSNWLSSMVQTYSTSDDPILVDFNSEHIKIRDIMTVLDVCMSKHVPLTQDRVTLALFRLFDFK